MECTRCNGKLKVSHSYGTPAGRVQRQECEDCLLVHITAVILVKVDPKRGGGAMALAKRLEAGEEAPWNSTSS